MGERDRVGSGDLEQLRRRQGDGHGSVGTFTVTL
jgi:hypothetical protein